MSTTTKPVNQKAWFLVLPVIICVAFSAILPLMTVVNYSVQDILSPDRRVFVGTEWFTAVMRDQDLHAQVQARRSRKLSLDELVAGTLLLYPTYVSCITNRFTTAEQTLYELQHWHALPQPGATSRWQELKQRLNSLLGMKRLRS